MTNQAALLARVTSRIERLASGLGEPSRGLVLALASRPGKGLRAALVAACASAGSASADSASADSAGAGSADPELVIRLGAVVELIHLASLLHDDIVDRAPTRRGGPTAQTVAGAELAALAGLACFALAGMEAASIGGGAHVLTGRACSGLSYGQVLDVERAFDTSLTLDDYAELAARKTGELFRLSCLLGAAAGDAATETGRLLGSFGLSFGIAFQIMDDCLDLAADDTGKPAGLDHLRGLFGAPTLCALHADASGALEALLLSPDLTIDDITEVRRLVIELGGLAAAHALAREYWTSAAAALDSVDGVVRDRVLAVTSDGGWNPP